MLYRRQAGNTALEYTLLAALIAVAALAALSLMGNSVSGLLAQPDKGAVKNDMEAMVSLEFGTGGHGSGSNGLEGRQTPRGSQPTTAVMRSTKSDGVNATSTDGVISMIQALLAQAAKMQLMSNETENNELADWYRETSRYAYRLAGSEATFAYHDNPTANASLQPLLEGSLGKGDAIRSMYEMKKEITKKIDQLSQSNTIPAMQKREAMTLANSILSGLNSQYGSTLAKYSDGKNLKLADIKRDFGGGERQYQRENLKPVASAVLKTDTAKQSVAIEASLQNGLVMDTKASE